MSGLSIIVLTKNEENNLPDLLDSVAPLNAEIFVVDSGSTDKTPEIAESRSCTVINHRFDNYAAQRNWAFENLPIQTAWTLCLDADERLTSKLVGEIGSLLQQPLDSAYDGYMLRKRTVFMGRWLRWGGQYPAYHLRLFKTGKAHCEARLYDQHFIVNGTLGRLSSDYIDILTDDISTWIDRHNRWATLEANEMILTADSDGQVPSRLAGSPIERKRFLRMKVYKRAPLFARAFLLFFFDYVVRLGFLDGRPGLIFYAMQRFWFRFLVDAKIYELRQRQTTI